MRVRPIKLFCGLRDRVERVYFAVIVYPGPDSLGIHIV
jgi:hypothetical protein